MEVTKRKAKPCKECGSLKEGKEKTYQDFKDTKTGEIKEIHTGYIYYCKPCIDNSVKAGKYKRKIWDCLDKIRELEGTEAVNQFKEYVGESVKD